MAGRGWVTLRLLWKQLTLSPSWLCEEGLALGATVAAISSTCALAFASALCTLPANLSSSSSSSHSIFSVAASLQNLASYSCSSSFTCPECTAWRLFHTANINRPPTGLLLQFSSDSLVTETVMSFTISFLIVSFAWFLVSEVR